MSLLTKEKKLRVGEHMSESLCALILVENTLLEYTEREHMDARSHMHGKCFTYSYKQFRVPEALG